MTGWQDAKLVGFKQKIKGWYWLPEMY